MALESFKLEGIQIDRLFLKKGVAAFVIKIPFCQLINVLIGLKVLGHYR